MPVDVDIYPNDEVIAVDPGRRCGVSIFRRGQFVACAAMEGSSENAERNVRAYPGAVLVLERQYERVGARQNFRAVETLMRRRLEWEFAAQQIGMPVVLVYPSQWQAGILPRIKGVDKKRLSRMFCMGAGFCEEDWTDDQCDATAMGAWYCQRVKWAQITA